MIDNIFLYVGDNAQGKTRTLVDIIEKAKKNDLLVVTNIERYKDIYLTDDTKLDYFKSHVCNIDICRYLILNTKMKNPHEKICRNLIELLYSEGDILVLDELDASLTRHELINICDCISRVAHLWKEIHVTGFSIELLRMFTHIDYDTDTESYNENVYLIRNNREMVKLAEEDTYEYFDTIRG